MTALTRRLGNLVLSLGLGLATLTGCGSQGPWLANGQSMAGFEALGRTGASPYKLFVTPDNGVAPILAAIENAKKSIHLEMYLFTDSNDSAKLIDALVARAHAGVDVEVLLEVQPFVPPKAPDCNTPQQLDLNSKGRQALLAGGVRVKFASPAFVYTHEKSMVIDNKIAYIMTCNFTGAAFTKNREYELADADPRDVAELAKIFNADWNGMTYTPGPSNLVVSPNNSRAKLLQLIDSAQKSMIIQFEFISDPEVMAHMAARTKAGVDVTMMLSYQRPDPCMGDTVAQETKMAHDAGITKLVFTKKLIQHGKMIVVDGQRAFVGSENLSANSLDNNREVGVIVTDPAVVNKLAQIGLSDYQNNLSATMLTAPAPDPGDDQAP
ncbi:MAG TPA: phospholipase D-like domain-containing protein [Oscillatoriaceae cyanobacterium]